MKTEYLGRSKPLYKCENCNRRHQSLIKIHYGDKYIQIIVLCKHCIEKLTDMFSRIDWNLEKWE